MKHTDKQIVDFILKRCGSRSKAAAALDVDQRYPVNRGQSLANWRTRGISIHARHKVWHWCRKHGLDLGDQWLLRPLKQPATNGGTNGRAGKGKPRKAKARTGAKGKRQGGGGTRPRSQQRRTSGSDRSLAA